MAFVILVDELEDFENLILLLETLISKETIILIHVDLTSVELKKKLELFLIDLKLNSPNTTNPNKLWINFLKETREEKLKRLESPYLMLPNKSGLKEEKFDIFLKPKRNFFLKNDFFPVKHSQWMILTKEFIDFIRTDQKVLLFLAWTEHTWVSDEFFFGMVALYSHPDKIINDNKRFINFKDKTEKHPIWLNYNTSSLFLKKTTNFTKDNNQNNFFWFRKVKISQDIDLKNAVDLERNLADLSLT
ncbi:hypothetical protein HDU92_006899 [Lobulomyces angularis]|nr:hypothetical protein HDU92_006899 [Lobulomyces angularis]